MILVNIFKPLSTFLGNSGSLKVEYGAAGSRSKYANYCSMLPPFTYKNVCFKILNSPTAHYNMFSLIKKNKVFVFIEHSNKAN